MERNINLEEITDGKRYDLHDLVRVGCNDCKGCSACCKGMGNSIVLDPFDIYQMTTNLDQTLEQLLQSKIALNVVDGIILPNLLMSEKEDACSFLNTEGRCTIHTFRPGICRIFPLGRIYEEEDYQYILQVHECKKENKTKVKVQKWIDIKDQKENKQFILDWHFFIKKLQTAIKSMTDEGQIRTLNMFVLNQFFLKPYEANNTFYEQFTERLNQVKQILSI